MSWQVLCGLVTGYWLLVTDILLHPRVDIRQVTTGEHPAFMTRKNCFSFCLCSVHLVTWLSSLISAQCKCHTMCRTTHDSGKDVKHLGNNTGHIPIVVCKSLGSDKYLHHIYHVVVLHPECRCSSSSNIVTTGSECLAPIFLSATFSMNVSCHQAHHQ